MRIRRLHVSVIAPALLGAALVAGAPAPWFAPRAAVADQARSAADDIAAARELVRARKWDDAKAAVAAMFDARRDDPSFRPFLSEAEELLQRATYGATGAVPDPAAGLGPGVTKYVPSTRAVQIRADAAATKSWLREADGTLTCPVPFEGDVSVELAWGDADDWAVLLGWDADAGTGWRIEARPQDHSGSPGRIVRMGEDGEKLLGPVPAPRSKDPQTVRISRAGSAIVVTAEKIQLAQENVTGGRRARVALRPSLDAGEDPQLPGVTISGHVDRAFARKAAAAAETAGFAAWRAKEWRRADALPAWVLEFEKSSRRWRATAVGGDAHADAVRRAVLAWFDGDAADFRSREEALADAELAEPVRALLDALRAQSDGRPDAAADALRRITDGSIPVALVQSALGRCLADRGDDAGAAKALDAARAADPTFAPAWEGPAWSAFVRGDTDATGAVLDGAAAAGATSDRIEEIRTHLRLLRSGPAWPKRAERTAGPFVVAGDVARPVLDSVAKTIEDTAADFAARVRPVPAGTRIRAWVFTDETAWIDWCREGHCEPEEDAVATRWLGVCVRVPTDGAIDVPVVRRAAAEACANAVAGLRDLPGWVADGLPRAFATPPAPPAAKGAKSPGLRPDGLAARFRRRFVPWPDLFLDEGRMRAESPDVFRVQASVAARALIAPDVPELRGAMGAYLDAVRTGRSVAAAWREVLEPRLAAIEKSAGRQ